MPPIKIYNFLSKAFFLVLILRETVLGNNDFGGDFGAGSLSGAPAPGPDSSSMGGKAASAMAIGTGASGPGNYAGGDGGGSGFKTPNYTQYTNQDFKREEETFKNI